MADPEVSSTLWFFTIASCGFAVTYVGASDESPCTPVMGMISPFGAQHLNRLPPEVKAAAMKCRNISEEEAQQRDIELGKRRRLCIGLHFPGVAEEDLEDQLCNFTQSWRSEDSRKFESVTECLTDALSKYGKNERLILELRAARIECLQKHFPDVPDHNKTLAYAMLSKKVVSQRNHIYDIEAKVTHCIRQDVMFKAEVKEPALLKARCQKSILPDLPEDQLESAFKNDLRNGSSVLDSKLTLCVFMETATGQWAKEELEIKFACLRDALPLLPASFRPVVSHRFGLDVQQEVIDMSMDCEAKGGIVTSPQGIQRPNRMECVLGLKTLRPHTEVFNATVIDDNPNPNEKVQLCMLHRRSSSHAFIRYREERKKIEKERQEMIKCYSDVLASMNKEA